MPAIFEIKVAVSTSVERWDTHTNYSDVVRSKANKNLKNKINERLNWGVVQAPFVIAILRQLHRSQLQIIIVCWLPKWWMRHREEENFELWWKYFFKALKWKSLKLKTNALADACCRDGGNFLTSRAVCWCINIRSVW